MKIGFERNSLRWKLIILILFLGIIPTVVGGLIIYWQMDRYVKILIVEKSNNQMQNITDRINEYLNDRTIEVEEFHRWTTAPKKDVESTVLRELETFFLTYKSYYERMILCDNTGKVSLKIEKTILMEGQEIAVPQLTQFGFQDTVGLYKILVYPESVTLISKEFAPLRLATKMENSIFFFDIKRSSFVDHSLRTSLIGPAQTVYAINSERNDILQLKSFPSDFDFPTVNRWINFENKLHYYVRSNLNHGGLTVILLTPLYFPLDKILFVHRWQIAGIFLFYLFLFVILFRASARVVSRLRELNIGSQRIIAGELGAQLSAEGSDEIASLTRQFNEMSLRLKQQFNEVKRMSKEVAEKEKLEELNRLKSEYISNVSHEIKSPLASIQWAASNLEEGIYGTITEKALSSVKQISKTVGHLQSLLKDLLDLSLIEAGRLEIVPQKTYLKEVVNEAWMQVLSHAEEKFIDITVKGDSSDYLFADPQRLTQILRNLLHNSIKYSDENQEIILSWSPELKKNKNGITVSIIDQGWGMSEKIQKKIYKRFAREETTGKTQGVGIGLNIVKNLVDLMNGEITFESTKGEGTVFNLWFPSGESLNG